MSFQNNNTPQQILSTFLQHDNEMRKQAENYINSLKEQNFEGGFQFFITGLQLENQDLASLSALLFKKKYFENLEDLQKIPQSTFEILIQNIKGLIDPNKNLQFLKRLADILVQLLTYLNQFNEIMILIETLSNNVANDSQNKLKQLILYMIEIVCEYSFDDELLIKYDSQFTSLFEKYLVDQDIQVKVSAMKTMTTFLVCISDEKFLKKFEMVFPVLLKTSVEAIQIDEEAGKSSLESLTELVETQSKFVKPITNDLIMLFTEIISAQSLNEQIRSIALNGLVILSVKSPSLVRKSDQFKQKTIPAIITMMSEINKVDLNEWNEELQENVIQKNDPSSAAQDALGKITPELGSKFMLPNSIEFIKAYLVSSEWPKKFAALMAISMMTEGAQKHFATELDNFMSIIIPLTNETDPRMQWAVLSTFAYLCSEYTPSIQVKYHEPILKFISKQMDNAQYTKLQLRAVQSIINFCQELLQYDQESQVLIPYADSILTSIQVLFNRSLEQKIYVLQEEILNAISMISVTLESQFANYYNSFMPGLKQLLINLPAESQQQINIRVLTIECIGFLLSSIKNTASSVFQDDLKLIMENLIQLQKQGNLTRDDPHHQAIISVYSHLAGCLKEKFVVYLPFIIDELYNAYMIDVEFTAQDTIDDAATGGKSNNKNIHSMAIDLKLFGGTKILSLNTSALEQKIVASQALFTISLNLGQEFYPYCQKSAEIISQFMSFINSKEIRQTSMKTVLHLLKACQNEQQMAQIFNQLLPKMLAELQNQLKFENNEDAFIIFDEVNKCIQLFKFPSIEKNQILELLNCTTIGLRLQDSLKKDLLKRFEEEQQDCDDDQKEQFEDDYEDINNLMQVIMDISGKTVQLYKDYCEAIVVNNNLPFYYNILNKKTATDNEVLYAVCIFDEILEFCSEQIFNKAFPEIAKIYLDKCKTSSNYDILQSIYFGFGVFAQRCSPQLFQQFYMQICQSLVQMVEQQDSYSQDKIVCTECAISSIGKIALFQPECQGISRQELITNFLKLLPLKNEQEEAQNTHLLLLKQVQAKNPILLANESNVLAALNNIKNIDFSNPECEILNNDGKLLISQLIN